MRTIMQKDIASELRRRITLAGKYGITRSQIAAAAGVYRSQVGRIAAGKTVPTLTTASRILAVLGCRLTITGTVAKKLRPG